MSTRRKSSVPQKAATSENSGQYESRYQPTVFGTREPRSRIIARLTRESKIGKHPPLMKWSRVVARDSPNVFALQGSGGQLLRPLSLLHRCPCTFCQPNHPRMSLLGSVPDILAIPLPPASRLDMPQTQRWPSTYSRF